MFRRSAIVAALVCTTALGACQPGGEAEAARVMTESEAARAAIQGQMEKYARYLAAGHHDSLAMLHREGGTLLPPNRPAVDGREHFVAAFDAMATELPPGATFSFRTVTVVASEPVAVERGVYAVNIPATGTAPAATMTGKYLTYWHLVRGNWMIATSTWNHDAPPPAPVAP